MRSIQPKKTEFAKFRKIRVSGVAQKCNTIEKGSYGFYVKDNVKITGRQIVAIRNTVSRALKKNGAMYFRVFPQLPKTVRATDSRMGGGKGSVEEWIAPARAGTVILEVDNVTAQDAKQALEKAGYKISARSSVKKKRFAYLD